MSLPSARRIVGRVVAGSGQPVERFAIQVVAPGCPRAPLLFESSNGVFDIVDAAAEIVGVFVTAEGAPRLSVAPIPSGGDVDLGVLRLAFARTVCGVVFGTDGSPVTGAGVVLGENVSATFNVRRWWHGWPGYPCPTTDHAGRFRFERVGPERHTLLVQTGSSARFAVGVVPEGTDDQECNLSLEHAGEITFDVGDIPVDMLLLDSDRGIGIQLKQGHGCWPSTGPIPPDAYELRCVLAYVPEDEAARLPYQLGFLQVRPGEKQRLDISGRGAG